MLKKTTGIILVLLTLCLFTGCLYPIFHERLGKIEGDVTGICVEQSEDLGAVVLAGKIIKVTMGNSLPDPSGTGTDETGEGSGGNQGKPVGSDGDEDGIVTTSETTAGDDPEQGAG